MSRARHDFGLHSVTALAMTAGALFGVLAGWFAVAVFGMQTVVVFVLALRQRSRSVTAPATPTTTRESLRETNHGI